MVDDFGPIRDTIKSTVAAKGIEKMKNRTSELKLGLFVPHVKSL